MKYPVLDYQPGEWGPSDQPLEMQLVDLTRLEVEGYLRIVHHGGEKGYHLKLVLNDEEAISLFVWNEKVFKCLNTLARSYGVIPIEEIEIDPEEGDEIVAEGRYRLSNGRLEIWIEKMYRDDLEYVDNCRYLLRLRDVKVYVSKKHGYSARPEYFLIALKK